MAYTSIKTIRFNIENSINYICDAEKTALSNAIDYAYNRDKTETTLLESALNCNKDNAYQEMMGTKFRFEKLKGVQGYHLIQSFKGQEATPQLAHRIARELADRLIGDGYQAVVSTHLNTGNIHNHIVWNSVDCFTGAKYISNSKSYYLEVRRISDELCQKYGLSIIDADRDSKGNAYAEWQAEKNGEPTYRSIIRDAIDEAIRESFTFPQFIDIMEEKGFRFKLDLKRPSIRFQGRERYARFDRLGKGYDLEDIKERIAGQSLDSYEQHFAQEYSRPQRPPRKYSVLQKTSLRSVFSLRGIRGLYFHYLYRMGVLPKRGTYQRKPSAYLLDEIRQLDKRISMYEYLQNHNISTIAELHTRRDVVQRQIDPLMEERRRLYKQASKKEAAKEITLQLKPLRAELALCRDIEQHSLEIGRRLRTLREAEKERVAERREDRARGYRQEYRSL